NAGLSMEDFQGAARSLEQARRLGVADAEMLSMLGQLSLQEDIQEEAVLRFEEAFALGEPSPLRQEQAIRGLVELGRVQEAESLMEKMGTQLKFVTGTERKAVEGTVLKLKVRLYVMQDRIPEAGALLQKGLEESPMDGELLLLQAELLRGQAQREEAVLVL